MGLNDLPTLGLIRSRMAWLTARHAVIADNIAHSAKPGFVPRDLAPFASGARGMPLALPESGGMAGSETRPGFGTTQRGGPVSLETEAAALSETTLDYQLAASLYSRSFRLIKTALGKR